jgi:hypothetical protein
MVFSIEKLALEEPPDEQYKNYRGKVMKKLRKKKFRKRKCCENGNVAKKMPMFWSASHRSRHSAYVWQHCKRINFNNT